MRQVRFQYRGDRPLCRRVIEPVRRLDKRGRGSTGW